MKQKKINTTTSLQDSRLFHINFWCNQWPLAILHQQRHQMKKSLSIGKKTPENIMLHVMYCIVISLVWITCSRKFSKNIKFTSKGYQLAISICFFYAKILSQFETPRWDHVGLMLAAGPLRRQDKSQSDNIILKIKAKWAPRNFQNYQRTKNISSTKNADLLQAALRLFGTFFYNLSMFKRMLLRSSLLQSLIIDQCLGRGWTIAGY